MGVILNIDGRMIDAEQQLIELDRADCEDSLYEFVKQMWHVVEPATPLKEGWVMEAICEHLEAVTYGEITRLLINVPPGASKSLLTNVFWPAWEWTKFPHFRYVTFSYAAHLTERDNRRFRDVITSVKYRQMFGDKFKPVKLGEEYVSNDAKGFKLATSIGGVGTGERGDRVILDDPHSVADNESETIRKKTVEWFSQAMSNRLNDLEKGAIVTIMQRVHEDDVSGYILDSGLPYEHLMIPAEYEPDRSPTTCIGWKDPRTEPGETFWEERFPKRVLDEEKRRMGSFGYSGQYQQRPDPAGGGVIKREWWQLWEHDKYPSFDYIVAYLDTAYTLKTQNDPSAMVVFGVFTGDSKAQATRSIGGDGATIYSDRTYSQGSNKVMTMAAWTERLEFHELIKKAVKTCKTMKVDLLLIENKAAGITAAQEIRRVYSQEDFGVQLHDPKSLDKLARLYSVQHLFEEGMIYAPDRSWADTVITQVAAFPKAKHDDLVDCVSGGLRYLRDIGILTRLPERLSEIEDMKKHVSHNNAPLYPV